MLQHGEYVGRPQFQGSRESRNYIVDDALDPDMPQVLIDWGLDYLPDLWSERALSVGGFQAGTHMDVTELEGFDFLHELVHKHRFDAARAMDIPMDDDVRLELWISARTEGQYFHWHSDADYATKNEGGIQTRLATFCYYAHTEPRAWYGGEFEFADGTLVEAKNNRLSFFPTYQIHRVRALHAVPWGLDTADANWPDVPELQWRDARWSVAGWVHRLHGPVDYGELMPGSPR